MNLNLILLSTSVILTFLLLHKIQKIFLEKKLIDKVINRSSHKVTATRNGGFGIFLNIFIISSVLYFCGIEIFDYSIIIPLSLLFIVGLYDDIYNIDFKLKFIFQIIAAKIMIDNGFIVDNLHGILGIYSLDRILAQMLTIFIILSIINAINFIDGVDGLAITIVSIFLISFEYFISSDSPFFYITLIIVASLIPLLFYNIKKKRKIFLGDSGSLFLGGLTSIYILYILSNDYLIKSSFDLNKILFVVSIFIYPIVDLIRIVIVRINSGKSPFEADKNHIHHIVLNKVGSHLKTTAIISILSVLSIILFQLLNNFIDLS
jgi:UDP-N-acetylmuramyl pentapeptide phosphotransferase/UDP-N-acetylglucosamine-1-phosphate transferase